MHFTKNKKDKVVYTCLTGNFNNLIKHKYTNKEYDYICFTDNTELLKKKKIGAWQIKPLAFNKLDNTKNARWHKLHPHIILNEYDESIWLDGYINIKTPYIFKQIEEKKQKNDILIPIHNERNCVYKELTAISKYELETDQNLSKMKNKLEEEDMPHDFGLNETNIVFRKHNKKTIIKLMEQWWYYIENVTKRDQASWTLVLYKNNIDINKLYLENIRQDYQNYSIEKDVKNSKNKVSKTILTISMLFY